MNWLRWQSIVDLAVLAGAIHVLLRWARGTRALRLVLVILALYGSGRLAWKYDLTITGWLLDLASLLLVLMLLFFFQPELRHAFLRLDNLLGLGLHPAKPSDSAYQAIAQAAFIMAAGRIGALMLVARKDPLEELGTGGVALNAEISPEIITAIFRKESPIHDGAMLIESGRIARAGVILPFTHREDVPPQFGTRHRAAMGAAERSDALVIAVSEERGEVTLMYGLEIRTVASASELAYLLEELSTPPAIPFGARLRRWLLADLNYKLASAGLAVLLWLLSMLGTSAAVRTIRVPVEFGRVPAGMEITSQSALSLDVQIRGPGWLLASARLTGITARFDLGEISAGWHTLKATPANLNLPPGLTVERVDPEAVVVRIVKTGQ